jgi:hypothetical protein
MYHYEMNEQVVKKEKAAARDLRRSRWWQTKIARPVPALQADHGTALNPCGGRARPCWTR